MLTERWVKRQTRSREDWTVGPRTWMHAAKPRAWAVSLVGLVLVSSCSQSPGKSASPGVATSTIVVSADHFDQVRCGTQSSGATGSCGNGIVWGGSRFEVSCTPARPDKASRLLATGELFGGLSEIRAIEGFDVPGVWLISSRRDFCAPDQLDTVWTFLYSANFKTGSVADREICLASLPVQTSTQCQIVGGPPTR